MRNQPRNTRISTWRNRERLFSFALLLCSVALCQLPHSQIVAQTANPKEKPVERYALIFHPTRKLTSDELKQRPIDIAAWVQYATDLGIVLDPRAFGETVATFSAEGGQVVSHKDSSDPALSTIVFFESSSEEQAVDLARRHPGLRYGVTVELREWTVPQQIAAKP